MNSTRQDRQDYYDIELSQFQRFDIVQLKYDGWWCRLVISPDGNFTMYSRTGRELRRGQTTPQACGVYIGEWMFGTNWAQSPERKERLFLFDCWQRGDTNLEGLGYRTRYQYLVGAAQFLSPWMHIVPCVRASSTPQLWQDEVINGPFEGVVFRRFDETVADRVYRCKKDVTDEYKIIGVKEGKEGKFANMLGAFVCVNAQGVECSVGGGMDEKLRRAVWDHPAEYIGRVIEVVGKTRFEETGLLRHPNFVRFKDTQ